MNPLLRWLSLLLVLMLIHSCASYKIQKTEAFDPQAGWVMLPIINNSDTPEAGERAAEITDTLLRSHGMTDLSRYLPPRSEAHSLPELDQQYARSQAITWGVAQGHRYGFGGNVQEWRYKSGLDAEPAVGVTLTVTDLSNGKIVWSATGSKTGWGRSNLSETGQKLIGKLVNGLPLK